MEPVSRHTTSPPASFIWQEKSHREAPPLLLLHPRHLQATQPINNSARVHTGEGTLWTLCLPARPCECGESVLVSVYGRCRRSVSWKVVLVATYVLQNINPKIQISKSSFFFIQIIDIVVIKEPHTLYVTAIFNV